MRKLLFKTSDYILQDSSYTFLQSIVKIGSSLTKQ